MRHLRRAIVLAAVLAAVPVAVASASRSLSGTYETTVKSAGTLDGTYKISFYPGRFTLVAPYNITGHGTYSLSGARITLHGPGSCKPAGVYEYKFKGSTLSFRKIKDPCARAAVLTAHAMKKI
ncbi:MAG TPA: hypothetical protein VL979_04165 [Solirubrobacteraceae bacterium]|nr:hypothetical protein [Solirubrobacteraceae bacterium]